MVLLSDKTKKDNSLPLADPPNVLYGTLQISQNYYTRDQTVRFVGLYIIETLSPQRISRGK